MTKLEWAEEEVRLAKMTADEYGRNCLDTALSAYMKLLKEGRSGYSYGRITEIIRRLIDGKPLTAINDLPDVWTKTYEGPDKIEYVCKRMPSLIKTVYSNNVVTYTDLNRSYCVNMHTKDVDKNQAGIDIINALYPIEMPYYPPLGYYAIYYLPEDDTDGLIFYYLIKPNGEKVTLNVNKEEPEYE